LIKTRIDLDQHVALMDGLAFREICRLQLAIDLAVDRRRIRRLHDAETSEINRHVACGGNIHRHRNRGRLRMCGLRRFYSRVPPQQDTGGDQQGDGGTCDDRVPPATKRTAGMVCHRNRSGC
jgi:hypothetical protein